MRDRLRWTFRDHLAGDKDRRRDAYESSAIYAFANEITIPPATINNPPIITIGEGVCLKKSQEMSWAMMKKKTTYSPRSFPKSQGGALTVKRQAKRPHATA